MQDNEWHVMGIPLPQRGDVSVTPRLVAETSGLQHQSWIIANVHILNIIIILHSFSNVAQRLHCSNPKMRHLKNKFNKS